MHISSLLDYSDKCRHLLRETLNSCPELLHETFVTTSNFNSIAKLFAHSVAAEERLVTLRIQNLPLPVFYEVRAADTLDGLFADAEMIRSQTRQFIASLTDEDWVRPITFTIAQQDMTRTVEEVLFHVINHENYHRGQIITELQRRGIDPPNFDYLLLR